MNPYSLNTIKLGYLCPSLVYNIDNSSYSESIYLSYLDDKGNALLNFLCTNDPILSNWLKILDYDTGEKKAFNQTAELLVSALHIFGIQEDISDDLLDAFFRNFDKSKFTHIASSVLDILKECFDLYPILCYLYPYYYTLLYLLYLYSEESYSYEKIKEEFSTTISILSREVFHLTPSYKAARKYIQSVLIEPYADNASIPSSRSAALYHSYCKIANISDFYTDTYDYPTTENYLKDTFGNHTITWSSYFGFHSQALFSNSRQYHITSFSQFLHIGLSIMLSNEMVLRKCRLCNGYFQTKHSSDQMYCSRIYKNTSATCNEVGVRKTYKEKLFQHPIHQEFTKSYNKLYGRIRRGKIPNDTPLMGQLKKLHDEYTEKYENTHKKDRDAIWREYIQKNKELLG